jgi:hypothetical protein
MKPTHRFPLLAKVFAGFLLVPLAYLAVPGGYSVASPEGVPPGLSRMKDPIEGVWNAKVNITVCNAGVVLNTFDAIGLFASNGTFHDTNATNPALRSAAFGTWSAIGPRTYEFALRFFRFDPMGANVGSSVVRHRVVLDEDGDSYRSEGTAEFYDADGVLLMTGCSDSEAVRFR